MRVLIYPGPQRQLTNNKESNIKQARLSVNPEEILENYQEGKGNLFTLTVLGVELMSLTEDVIRR